MAPKGCNIATMQTIDAKTARARLTDLLDEVTDGEEFVITKYGKPIALLTRPRQADEPPALAGVAPAPRPSAPPSQAEAKVQQERRDELLRRINRGRS